MENLLNYVEGSASGDYNTTTNLKYYEWYPWWPHCTGSDWYYYINSENFKIEQHGDKLVVDVLVAGLEKEDLEAFIDNDILLVNSSKVGWNGKINQSIYLSSYNIIYDPVVRMKNGVLRFEFPVKNEKKKLEIE